MVQISVVIPVFNKGFILSETLNSVLQQTFTNYEIIIINDGSTDNSIEVLSDFNDSRIQIFSQENKGAAAARNLGIKKSKGELIAFLDADDYWFPNHLEEISKLYYDFPNCGMYCSLYKIKTTHKHFQKTSFRGIQSGFRGIVNNYFYSNKPFRISWTSSLAITKDILEKFNGFNENITNGQDVELWTRIGLKHPIALSDKTTAIYNFNTISSLTKQNINSMNLMSFKEFEEEEKNNKYLKEFLDLHRFFYAIQFKTSGNLEKANSYYKGINTKNIGLTNQILFYLPSYILKLLYFIKRKLKRIGIEFSTYN